MSLLLWTLLKKFLKQVVNNCPSLVSANCIASPTLSVYSDCWRPLGNRIFANTLAQKSVSISSIFFTNDSTAWL